jgi:hypothetical protein
MKTSLLIQKSEMVWTLSYTRDLINRFSQVENGIIKRIVPLGDIMQNNTSRMLSHKARFQVSSDFQLTEGLEV